MSKNGDNGDNDDDDDDYEVGYGKPPKKNQFKSGHSGNPGGGKKGSRNMRTIIKRSINRPVKMKDGDRQVKVPSKEAAFLRLQVDALRGKPSALRQYFEMIERYAPEELEAVVEEMRAAEKNQEILKHFFIRELARGKSGDEPEEDE